MIKNGKTICCPICDNKFYIKKSQLKRRVFCSMKCKSLNQLGSKLSKETKIKISKSNLGKKKPWAKRNSPFIKGHKIKNFLKGKKLSREHRIKLSLAKTGEKEFSGFKQILDRRIRMTKKYLQWRADVFKRDNYHCQNCGDKGYLEAHHIISFSKLIKINKIKNINEAENCSLLWDIGNGITYCRECHISLDENIGKRGIGVVRRILS